MRTPQGFINWCLANPTDRIGPGSSWDQKCGSLVFRAGDFRVSAPSAWYAAQSTIGYGHHLYSASELPLAKVPLGWMVYFDVGGKNNGHVGMAGGNGQFLSANWRVTPMTPAHQALGWMGIQDYINRSGATYMGASAYYINATLDLSGTAGGGGTPIPIPVTDYNTGDTMRVMNRTADNVIALYDEYHWQEIGYGAGTPTWISNIVTGLAHSLTETPYSATAWNYRSNLCPAIKNPVFIFNAGTQTVTRTDAPAAGSFTPADRAMLDDIASKGELGQALTSTVSLVNDHADTNKNAIIAKIDTIPGTSGAPLSISLTGTASPE